MLFLSSVGATQPDYVALAMVVALILFVAVMALRKYQSKKQVADAPAPAPVSAPVVSAPAVKKPVAPGTAGKLKIHDVEPKTAAMLMAITADKLGKPLNELRFISIREVK